MDKSEVRVMFADSVVEHIQTIRRIVGEHIRECKHDDARVFWSKTDESTKLMMAAMIAHMMSTGDRCIPDALVDICGQFADDFCEVFCGFVNEQQAKQQSAMN